jgi:ketosteroid isomerase-like protein
MTIARPSPPALAAWLVLALATVWTATPGRALVPDEGTPLADEATRKAVTAVKQGILAGHKARDRAALDRLYADGYTAISAKGEITTKKELLEGLATWPEIVEGRYELGVVRRWGNVAVANGHGRIVYRNPDGTTRVSEYDSVNVFELVNGRWYYAAAFLP